MSFTKATPRTVTLGIQDVSFRTPVPVPTQIPTHLPLVYLLTAKGDSLPHIAIGNGFNQMYDVESLDPLSPFATHATMGARQAMRNGNMCMIQRIIPPNAKKALLRFSVELIPAYAFNYSRDSDGQYIYNADGSRPMEEVDGLTQNVGSDDDEIHVKSVMRAIWHVGLAPYDELSEVGAHSSEEDDGDGPSEPDAFDVKAFGKAMRKDDYRNGYVEGSNGQPLGGIRYPNGEGGTSTMVMHNFETSSSSETAATSILFPVLDLEVSTHGSFGNLNGVIFHAPNNGNDQNGDVSAMEVINAFLYRMFMVRREKDSTTPLLVETLGGDPSVDFTFKQNVLHPRTKNPLNAYRAIIPPYQNLKDPTITPIHGPFGRVNVYEDHVLDILSILINGSSSDVWPDQWAELAGAPGGEREWNNVHALFGRTSDFAFGPNNRKVDHLLNFFTGVDQNNVPYGGYITEDSVNFGGVALGNNNVHYASGGRDGLRYDEFGQPDRLANLEMFDRLVREQVKNFGSLEAKLLDDARYPLSNIWDTGFSLPTKYAILSPLALRKDVWVGLSTQAVADYANTDNPHENDFAWMVPNNGATESSLALLLSERAAMYPESEIFGTAACRAIIVGRAGELLNTTYQGILPLTIDVIDKVAKYMGAGDGVWKSAFSFSSWPNNTVTEFADANITWRTPGAYDKDWENGLIWVQYFDDRSLYYPAFQTVYKNDTSVLNSFFTMTACVELTKICTRVIRELQGDDKMTDELFMQTSNRRISELASEAKFDNRFKIVPETFKTPADTANGFSWSVRAHLYANNMRTLGQLTIVVHRREELDAA